MSTREIDTLVADALAVEADRVEVPADLRARVDRRITARRRTRRNRRIGGGIAFAAIALALAATIAAFGTGRNHAHLRVAGGGAREPAVVVPVGHEVRTLVDGRLAEKWDAGNEVVAAYRLSDGRYVAHTRCASECDGGAERLFVRSRDGRVTQIRIAGVSLENLLDVAESDGHAYALVEGVAVDLLPSVQQLRLYRYDIDSRGITELGTSCCDPTIVTSASYARGLVAETVAHIDGASDDLRIERVSAGGATITKCTPGPIGGRPTFPLAAALSPDASRVATVVGVVDAPELWLTWCDLATGAHDRVELGRVIPPGRMHLNFDGHYALASGMIRLPAMLVDTRTKHTTAIDAKHTEHTQHFTTLANPTTIPSAR